MREKITISAERVNLDSTIHELLTYLDECLNSNRTVEINVTGTDLEFVPSLSCGYCGKEIPVDLPRREAEKENGRPCSYCDSAPLHLPFEYDPNPFMLVLTRYNLRYDKNTLAYRLKTVGFQYGLPFLVTANGKEYDVSIINIS